MRYPPFCSPVGLWALPLGPRQIGTLWRWVAGALGRVLACLAHRHARPAGGGADVGDRREQGALPEVVGLPPGGLIKQVRFGPAMEGAPLLRPALRTRASRLVDRGGGDAAAAEHQYAALLPVDGRVLGPEHPATLGGRNDLARWTEEAGDPAAVRDHYAELLPLRERVLGPEHPATLADPARARPLDRQGGRCPQHCVK